nr:MAG TPA: outer membrane protein assembly factor [Caudoviricetes sp.]
MIKLIFAIVIALFIFSLLACIGIYKVSTNYEKYKKFFEQNKK